MPLQLPTQFRGHHHLTTLCHDSVKKVETDRWTKMGKRLVGINTKNSSPLCLNVVRLIVHFILIKNCHNLSASPICCSPVIPCNPKPDHFHSKPCYLLPRFFQQSPDAVPSFHFCFSQPILHSEFRTLFKAEIRPIIPLL